MRFKMSIILNSNDRSYNLDIAILSINASCIFRRIISVCLLFSHPCLFASLPIFIL